MKTIKEVIGIENENNQKKGEKKGVQFVPGCRTCDDRNKHAGILRDGQ